MREGAVFAFIVAIFVAFGLVIFSIIAISNGHEMWVPMALVPTSFSFIGLWCIGHWMDKLS